MLRLYAMVKGVQETLPLKGHRFHVMLYHCTFQLFAMLALGLWLLEHIHMSTVMLILWFVDVPSFLTIKSNWR
jgi:hypothetical protein